MPKLTSAVYHLDVKTAEFVADNGDHLLRSGGTVAWRFNNPGNMRPPSKRVITTNIGKATMSDGGEFLIFPDYDTGRSELKRLLRDPDSYAPRTIAEAIPKFAPKKDRNNPEKYIKLVEKIAGVSRDNKLADLTDDQLDKVMNSIETIEGYHYLSETRSEKWVKAATVTLSDGARPLSRQPVVVRQNGKETKHVTDEAGRLPAIPHSGGKIEILTADVRDKLETISSIAQQDASKAYLFVRRLFVAEASTAPHAPRQPDDKPARTSFTYRVEPGDTLSKIAQRFKTTVAVLKADNHLKSDLIIVGKTLQIYSGGHTSTPNSGKDGHGTAPNPRPQQHQKQPKPIDHRTATAAPAAADSAHVNSSRATDRTHHETAAAQSSQTKVDTSPVVLAGSGDVPAKQNDGDVADANHTPAVQSSSSAAASTPAGDKATSAAKTDSQPTVATPARSQDGQGRPLGLVTLAQPRATWMAIAIREAERWGGVDESEITKTMNYHDYVDNKNWLHTLVGGKNAWCSAFVNWTMKEDGRAMLESRADRHRARGFIRDPGNFPQIEKPVFGAVAVRRNLGHVMFIYGINPKNGNMVVLGGNQGGKEDGSFGGTIDFTEFAKNDFYGYYVPVTYLDFAKEEIKRGTELPQVTAHEMNKLHKIKEPKGAGTR
ncbi:LysM peptidoglycan-binding domain-containing protein [Burkholderia stagnalis]|uniref:LysM peptidoglycan-binding domain-containing protein n=1 Tax=Burkholderia stagnalis TaxID=1503054 RepID=UPI000F81484C|nr:LysM peptidoglycan-binding domain-containing protein [Burkholderia stagnalis]